MWWKTRPKIEERTIYFQYGDKVEIRVGGNFFGQGTIVGTHYDPGGDYCRATHSYIVKFKNGETGKYLQSELQMADSSPEELAELRQHIQELEKELHSSPSKKC